MQRYIALLRGVNVGGNNKIAMPELKQAFEKNGFTDVSTYINSGNIIFSSGISDEAVIQKECESVIKKRFGMNIAAAVISAQSLKGSLMAAPEWWDKDPESKHNAIFVIQPASAEEVMRQVGDAKPEYEKTESRGPVIFWSAPLATFSRTRWSNIVSTRAYASVTIRNANTAKKLLQLAD